MPNEQAMAWSFGGTFTYHRLGRKKTVKDAVIGPDGERTFDYNAGLELQTETITADGTGLYRKTITRNYEDGTGGTVAGRDAGFSIGTEYAVSLPLR